MDLIKLTRLELLILLYLIFLSMLASPKMQATFGSNPFYILFMNFLVFLFLVLLLIYALLSGQLF